MTFRELVAQVIEWLQRDQKVSYRALKRQFNLDDDCLEDVNDAILYAHAAVDDGRGLVWTGEPAASEPEAQHAPDAESRFQAVLPELIGFLQRHKRVTYRRLTHIFGIDRALLEDVRHELAFRQIARDA